MSMISKAALAAALVLGAGTLVASPAMAYKDKDKKDQAAGPSYSDAFRKVAVPAQEAAKAQDFAKLDSMLPEIDAAAKNDDEKLLASQWRLQASLSKKDYAGAQAALDALIANPKLPQDAKGLGYFSNLRGALAMQDKKYAEALPFLQKAADLGFVDQQPYSAGGPAGSAEMLYIRLALANFETGHTAEGAKWIDQAIKNEEAAGRKAPEEWYGYVVARVYKAGDRTTTAAWLGREVAAYPSPQNWRNVLVQFAQSTNAQKQPLTKAQRLDLYRLMRATDALADQNDYDDYANTAQNSGLPWETKMIIEEGRAKGKIPAGDAGATTLYNNAQTSLKSEMPLASYEAKAASAPDGKLSVQTADAYLASGNYAKAVALYRQGLAKGGVKTDEANSHLGIALANSGDKAGALEAFRKVQASPASDIAEFWITWLNMAK